LAEAAVSTSDSLGQLAEIEKANAPKTKLNAPIDGDAIGLGSLASVDWTGPIEPLVQKLANTGQYKYRVVGRRPAIPVLVAVYAVNMPVSDILRDANLQAGTKADIAVYANKKLIELRYR
jgi:defect-in-organelle-trafficking protein DotD